MQIVPGREAIDAGFANAKARDLAEPSYALQKKVPCDGASTKGFSSRTSVCRHRRFGCGRAGTSLYGTGMVFGRLLRNGQSTIAWNIDNYGYPYYNNHSINLYESHPWVLAVRANGTAYRVLADTSHKIVINTTTDINFSSDSLFPLIVIERPSPQDVLRELAKLTGYTPTPPKWAIGYHQPHFSYTPELKVLSVASQA